MTRALWIGAAAAVAVAAAIPLWLVLDDGAVRRLGSIDATAGQSGRLTIAGVNGGTAIPIDRFAFSVRRPVGSAQPELGSIEVTLPLATSVTQLVSRVATATKAASAKVELIRSIDGVSTALLTFDLTGVTVEGFDDSYSTIQPSSGLHDGVEKIALRYDAMTMTCIPFACAEPTHPLGSSTELGVPDLGTQTVRLQSGTFSVPKNMKEGGSVTAAARMATNYLLPGLLSRARDGKAFEKTLQVDLVRHVDNTQRKTATYKLGGAVITSLAITQESGDPPLVQAEFSSTHFGVTSYSYTATGALDKSPTSCYTSCTGL